MTKLRVFVKNNLYQLLIFAVVISISIANYAPGTYLLGWDNLQTELNPWLAVKRSMLSSWQEYQSFGLASGMAHAADIVRSLFLLVISIVLPQSIVRYFFHLLMLFLGGLGTFYFFKKFYTKPYLAFVGALFYMLNFGTIQIFGMPFEPFSVFFGLLPWELLVFYNFFHNEKMSAKSVFLLVFVNFLATPQAYLQTLFVVYALVLCLFGLGYLAFNRNIATIKRLSIAALLVFLVNAFWILPQIYFVNTSVSVVKEAKINTIATVVVSDQNLDREEFSSYARLIGFYYDLKSQKGDYLFDNWRKYFDFKPIAVVSFLPILLALAGTMKKRPNHASFLSVFIVVTALYLKDIPMFFIVGDLIEKSPFLSQIFRSPFTKFITPLALFYAFFLVSGIEMMMSLIQKITIKKLKIAAVAFSFVLLAVPAFPIFTGNFFASEMRVKLPEYYRVAIDYFNTEVDENKRVALLPEPTFWGWFSQKWGYDGSGFIWYGIKQPVISRTFDVWSLKSESYYWEIKYAIESQNIDLFEDTLNKYNVGYLILDKTLKPLNNVEESMQYDQLERIIKSSEVVSLEREFGELVIYRVHQRYGSMAFGAVLEDIVSVGPSINFTNKDQAFNDLAFYRDSSKPDYIYPFLDLTTQNLTNDKRWTIEDVGDKLIFSSNLSDYNLVNYALTENRELLKATLFLGDEIKEIEQSATTTIADGKLIVTISKDEALSFRPSSTEVRNCSNLGDFEINRDGDSLIVKTKNSGVACFGYSSKLLPHWNGYLVQLEMDNIEGKNLFFYIFGNWLRKQAKIENVLSEGINYQIINPGYLLDDGYFFSFQNQSTEKRLSHNELKSLKVYLLPVNYLKTLKLERVGFNASEVNSNFTVAPRIEKVNYHTYILHSESQENFNFIVMQSFDEGWKAYKVKKDSTLGDFFPFLGGKKVEDHFMVNSWANGWKIDKLETLDKLVVIYEPQILQDIGLAILLITLTISAIFFVREPK